MSKGRFNELRPYFALMFSDPASPKEPWWQIRGAVDGFNEVRKVNISASSLKVLDEIMCAYQPRKSKTGGLPHLSFVMRKPKPLGESLVRSLLAPLASHILFGYIQETSSNLLAALLQVLCSAWRYRKEKML